jgi:hypothetical protein
MNEPKKRGRSRKVEQKPCDDCGQAVGHYDDCPVGMGVVDQKAAIAAHIDDGLTRIAEKHALAIAAQAYAMRVWNGQADIVPRAERIRRIKLALEGQNLPFEGVVLP